MAEQFEYTAEEAAGDRAKIHAALDAMSVDARGRLEAAVTAVEGLAKDELGEWVFKKGVMSYLNEAAPVYELRAVLYDAGPFVPFTWPAWSQSLGASEPPIDDPVSAVATITGIVRGDRFSEGTFTSSIESGLLIKAIRVALAG